MSLNFNQGIIYTIYQGETCEEWFDNPHPNAISFPVKPCELVHLREIFETGRITHMIDCNYDLNVPGLFVKYLITGMDVGDPAVSYGSVNNVDSEFCMTNCKFGKSVDNLVTCDLDELYKLNEKRHISFVKYVDSRINAGFLSNISIGESNISLPNVSKIVGKNMVFDEMHTDHEFIDQLPRNGLIYIHNCNNILIKLLEESGIRPMHPGDHSNPASVYYYNDKFDADFANSLYVSFSWCETQTDKMQIYNWSNGNLWKSNIMGILDLNKLGPVASGYRSLNNIKEALYIPGMSLLTMFNIIIKHQAISTIQGVDGKFAPHIKC